MELKSREERETVIFSLYQYDLYESYNQDDKVFIEIIKDISIIDNMINSNLHSYTLARLSYIDRAIIRLATFELLKTKTPTPIIINEAIEITKIYCNLEDELQHKFNNSVIDNIAKAVRK